MAVADFNFDGRDDLALGDQLGSRVTVLLSRGDGTFSLSDRYYTADDLGSILTADFNRDGLADLAITNLTTNEAWVYVGRGNGRFGFPNRFPTGLRPFRIASGDFNADGRPDLAAGNLGSRDITILLNETPSVNRPPVAVATGGGTFECASPAGSRVVLDGSGSTDPDSSPGTNDDIVLFKWFEDLHQTSERLLGTGAMLEIALNRGPHRIALRVADREGISDTDETLVTVADTTPPELHITLTPSLLWPPNHRLVEVQALANATDACGPAMIVLDSITSSEPDDAPAIGDGSTSGDAQEAEPGNPDFEFLLRAERSGSGGGRTYTVTYKAIDITGNQVTAGSQVFVPHNQGGVTEPVVLTAWETASGTVIGWPEVVGATSYKLIRGHVGELVETQEVISLGPVTCTAISALRKGSVVQLDPMVPPRGEAFFYLVSYDDGLNNSYGTAQIPKPRVPGAIDCR